MRTDGQTLKGNVMVISHVDLESVRAWAKATLTMERVAEVGLVAATLVVTGYLGSVLVKGIEIYSISGF